MNFEFSADQMQLKDIARKFKIHIIPLFKSNPILD